MSTQVSSFKQTSTVIIENLRYWLICWWLPPSLWITNPEQHSYKQLKTTYPPPPFLQGSPRWPHLWWLPLIPMCISKWRPCICRGGFPAWQWGWALRQARVQFLGSRIRQWWPLYPRNGCADSQRKKFPPNKTASALGHSGATLTQVCEVWGCR